MNELNFCHGGGLGDIVYSLHFVQKYIKLNDVKTSNLYLVYGLEGNYHHIHPFGNVLLTEESILWVKSFFESLSFINEVIIFNEYQYYNNLPPNTIDLNIVRGLPLNFEATYIPRWYYYTLHVMMNGLEFNRPWITLGQDERSKGKIVICRSLRYNNIDIDYSILDKYKNRCIFIGMEDEYNNFKQYVDCEYIKVGSALEAANLIGSCDLLIGNQTFFYSIAESAKVPRLCELSPFCPNTFSHGGVCNDILYSEQFCNIITKFCDNQNY